jgi:hypothetical protein
MLVTCKEGKLSNSSVPYSFRYFIILVIFIVFPLFMAKKDISPTINNVALFLLVGCEMASLDVINCAVKLTFLLPIMFD